VWDFVWSVCPDHCAIFMPVDMGLTQSVDIATVLLALQFCLQGGSSDKMIQGILSWEGHLIHSRYSVDG
jgi:hypothetical protein